MNLQKQISKLLGAKQIGVKFNGEQLVYNPPINPIRFCEACITSINNPMTLKKEDIACHGARRSFGFSVKNDEKLANHISEETNISLPFILNALKEIPIMDISVENIMLGYIEKPDIIIAFVKPDKITKLTLLYNLHFAESPLISPYLFMSVCANVAVQTFITKKMCVSLGCPESRKFGGVLEDEVIVGFPGSLLYGKE